MKDSKEEKPAAMDRKEFERGLQIGFCATRTNGDGSYYSDRGFLYPNVRES